MHLFSALMFAISANVDCMAVGLSYGIKHVRIDRFSNLIIACISTLGTLLSMEAGTFLSIFLSADAANTSGSVLLIMIGMWILLQRYIKKECKKTSFDEDNSGVIDGKEAVFLALALTINNMGLGIGGSITGLPVFWTCLFTFLCSLLFIRVSQCFAISTLTLRIERYADTISGLIILILGLYELFI